MVCEVCSRDYSEDGAPITDYQRWLAAPEPCPNCFPVCQHSTRPSVAPIVRLDTNCLNASKSSAAASLEL